MRQLYNCDEVCTNGRTIRCCSSCDIKGTAICSNICRQDPLKCGLSKPFVEVAKPLVEEAPTPAPESVEIDPFRADMFVKLTNLRNTVWMEDISAPGPCREYQEHHESIKKILAELDLILAEVKE